MENVPIKQAFTILKWWTGLKPLDKLLAFMVAVFVASASVNFYQYKEIVRIQAEKTVLEKETLFYAKGCEARVAEVTIKERNRSDSIINDLQKLLITRTAAINNNNEKIKKSLK